MKFGAFLLLLLTGCALMAPPRPADTPLRRGEVRSIPQAKGALTIGKSTKAEVRAALGEATVVGFDSGYEVWVYRLTREPPVTGDAGRAEFVVLFSPAGVVTKTRVRPVVVRR